MHRHTDTWKMQNSVGDLYEQASLLRNHNSCAQSTRGSILLLVIFRLHFHKNLLVHKLIASRILGSFHLRQTEQRTQDSLLLPIYKDIFAWELAHGHTDLNTHANKHTHTVLPTPEIISSFSYHASGIHKKFCYIGSSFTVILTE